MDFFTLSRKQLQTLCKKNKIPANITNVAMADALSALDQVEGLEEILNPIEVDAATPNVNLRTAGRASTQRKAARADADGSNVKVSVSARPLRGARVGQGVMEQENNDANVPPVTPAVSRRRATAVSTRRKKEVEVLEEDADKNGVQGQPLDVPKTPAAASVNRRRATGRSVTKIETTSGTSVQRTYSTRRSVRLLEKDLSKISLIDTEDTGSVKVDDDVSQELSNVSHEAEDSCDTEKGSSLQMDSTVVSEDTQEFEVSNLEQNTEYECQSHDSGSDMTLVEPHGSDEAKPEKVNCLELEAEPNASDEAGSELLPVLEETCDSSELETENKECVGARQEGFHVEASTDAIADVIGQEIADMVPDNVSVDITVQGSNKGGDQEDNDNDQDVKNDALVSLKELVELMFSHERDDKEDKNNEPEKENESNDSNLNPEGSSDSCDKSDDQGSQVLPVREESIVAMQDILPSEASEDALVEGTYQDTSTLTAVVADDVSDKYVGASISMSPVSDAPANINESVQCNTGDDQFINKDDDNQDIKDETGHLNLAFGNNTDEDYQYPVNVDANESDTMTGSEEVLEFESDSAGELQDEQLKEAKPEQMEAETDDAPDVTAVCTESSANGKHIMEVKNVTENASVNLEAEAQAEESEELVAEQEAMLDVDDVSSGILDGMCSPQIPHDHQQVSVESASGPLGGELSCKSNVPVDDEVVSEEDSAIPNQDTVIVSSENMTSDVSVQSVVSDPLKKNVTYDDKSMGELKRMLKKLKLDGEKSNCNKTDIVKEVDKKRTALQVLPQNRMTSREAQIDG